MSFFYCTCRGGHHNPGQPLYIKNYSRLAEGLTNTSEQEGVCATCHTVLMKKVPIREMSKEQLLDVINVAQGGISQLRYDLLEQERKTAGAISTAKYWEELADDKESKKRK